MGDDFCFVHAADLHLGGRRWVRSSPPARLRERIHLADRLALGALVDLCLRERASLLLCAGDVIDGWCRDHTVGLALVQELLRLRHAGCEVALLLGNHDARTRVTRPLLLPEHAFILGMGGAETRVIERLGVALHGWSCPEIALPADVAALYPEPLDGLLNIGLLHTSAEGCRGHVDYAPCSRKTLRRSGYDYWALGHVHRRAVIATSPFIVFPGNLQGRGPREAGPKGATVVRVVDRRVVAVEPRSLEAIRFETLVADVESAERFDDVLAAAREAVRDGARTATRSPVVARLVLQGLAGAACAFEVSPERRAAALRSVVSESGDDAMWVDEIWIDAGPVAGSWCLEAAA